jgi:hypothetical protein
MQLFLSSGDEQRRRLVMMAGKDTSQIDKEKSMESTLSCKVTFMTNWPRLSSLNGTKGWSEGTTKGNEVDIKVWPSKASEAVIPSGTDS